MAVRFKFLSNNEAAGREVNPFSIVVPALVPGIHVVSCRTEKTRIRATSPRMTMNARHVFVPERTRG